MSALADIETTPEQTDDAQPQDLLAALQAYVERYVDLPSEEHGLMLAAYVIHTWALQAAFCTPYLYISSAGPATGKTRLCDVLGVLCRNSDSGTDSPSHVLGQEIQALEPTLFFDEIDTVWAGRANNPLKRILNIGYQRGACIKRQRASQVERWSVFCPKILAGIRNNHLPESLISRCVNVEMHRRTRDVERWNTFHALRDPERTRLVERVAAFAEESIIDIANQRPEPLKALDDRANEITEPLLAIAAVLGREDDLRRALKTIYRKDAGSQSREQVILERVRQAFELQQARGGPADRIFSDELCATLGPSYTPRLLSILLAEMGFRRMQAETIRIDTQVRKGYYRSDFEPLFERWLDGQPTEEP